MKHKIYDNLIIWKNRPDRKPLIIEGARQVGKTYIVEKFGKNEFEKYAYFNFDSNEPLIRVFDEDLNVDRILTSLSAMIGFKIDENMLIFFDEIQECGKAVTALKYFCENKRKLYVIAAGSLLGLSYSDGTRFPVGKVDFLKMYPMSFREYLLSEGQDLLVELIENKDYKTIKQVKSKFENYFKTYCFIGGMPEVVDNYIKKRDFNEVTLVQKNILKSYDLDFSKHAKNGKLERIRMVWNAIPQELSKENKKFKYSDIKKGSRAKDFEDAIQFLKDAGLIYNICNIKKFNSPIASYVDASRFKMYALDIGLLSNMNNVSANIINEMDRIFVEYKGALAEQFTLNQLLANGCENVLYYTDETSRLEVDFVIELEGKVVPIEVKSGINLKAKSLNSIITKNKIEKAIRYSLADYIQNEIIEDIPLYAI